MGKSLVALATRFGPCPSPSSRGARRRTCSYPVGTSPFGHRRQQSSTQTPQSTRRCAVPATRWPADGTGAAQIGGWMDGSDPAGRRRPCAVLCCAADRRPGRRGDLTRPRTTPDRTGPADPTPCQHVALQGRAGVGRLHALHRCRHAHACMVPAAGRSGTSAHVPPGPPYYMHGAWSSMYSYVADSHCAHQFFISAWATTSTCTGQWSHWADETGKRHGDIRQSIFFFCDFLCLPQNRYIGARHAHRHRRHSRPTRHLPLYVVQSEIFLIWLL